jgi:SpoIID/LytB domain protein
VKGDSRTTITSASGARIATRPGSTYFTIGRTGPAILIKVATSPAGPWRRLASVRAKFVRVAGGRLVGVLGPSSAHWYRGVIDIVPSGAGVDVMNYLPLETYVSLVVPREMPASWPVDALMAQAVAARTYALRVTQVARARHKSYDICATTSCQVFGGYARTVRGKFQILESRSSNVATRATSGWIMTWRGKPILAEYSSSTGGYTTSGGVPYLAPRPDPWDASSPFHSWSDTVDVSQIQARWPAVGAVRSVRVVERDGRGAFGGRVRSLVISGSRGSIRVSGSTFQYAFGLQSDWFRVLVPKGQYRFTFNMSYGKHDAAVRFLQQRLRAEGVYPKTAPLSNYFGPITRAALQRYQRAHRIDPTGFLGPLTRARLNASA